MHGRGCAYMYYIFGQPWYPWSPLNPPLSVYMPFSGLHELPKMSSVLITLCACTSLEPPSLCVSCTCVYIYHDIPSYTLVTTATWGDLILAGCMAGMVTVCSVYVHVSSGLASWPGVKLCFAIVKPFLCNFWHFHFDFHVCTCYGRYAYGSLGDGGKNAIILMLIHYYSYMYMYM